MEDNPFCMLFPSSEHVRQATEVALGHKLYVSDVLTRVFLFSAANDDDGCDSLRSDEWPVAYVIRLPQLCADNRMSSKEGMLSEDNIAQGLAERLHLTALTSHLVRHQSSKNRELYSKQMALEDSPVGYLAHCYARTNKEPVGDSPRADITQLLQRCRELIGKMSQSVCLVHQQRGLSDTLSELLLQTLSGKNDYVLEFFSLVASSVNDSISLSLLFGEAVERVFRDHHNCTSLSAPTRTLYFHVLQFFSLNSSLAKLLIHSQQWFPGDGQSGRSYETTLLGKLMTPSTLALTFMTPSEYFPANHFLTQTEVERAMSDLHLHLAVVVEQAEKIISSLLRIDAQVKRAVIKWLVDCFAANKNRAQMAYRFQSGLETMLVASDGFFLNLNWVLLRLCQPFMVSKEGRSLVKLNSVDPAYCLQWSQDECSAGDSNGPLVDFSKETKLVPLGTAEDPDNSPKQSKPDFHFITHCFFLTHKSLILGMTQVIHRLQDQLRAYSQVHNRIRQMGLMNADPAHPIVRRFLLMQSQLCGLRTHAMHPDILSLALTFHASTAQWLVAQSSDQQTECTQNDTIRYSKLKAFPECLVDNMANFALFLRHSDTDILSLSSHLHSHFITFCTIFMGNSRLVHNPHIRAKLAQLVLLMTGVDDTLSSPSPISTYCESQRRVFAGHMYATKHLLPALMSIFIDIEFTGESMEFEDKFQYRLPMYTLLEFLWPIPSFRPCIESLAHQANESFALMETPLFLRFINMIVNDATVQLDEGLENLAKVKAIEDLIDSERWASLNEQEKHDNQVKLAEARMMARNRNLLAQKTMSALSTMTSDTCKPFVVESLVQRMANMLNYVLNLLVGPKCRQFKVKNAKQLNFKPDELVLLVITVYVNLGKEINFCKALLGDGRSFSMDLFTQARRVITVLHHPSARLLVDELTHLEERVTHCKIDLAKHQEMYENAPEEFLDPVTQEIMVDPVILPTSGTTMDRANIIRHLLSDQSDPFNRAHLTADMLTPNDVLKRKIEEWKTSV